MVFPALLLGLGGFGRRASEHAKRVTRVHGTRPKLSFPRELTFGSQGGREMILDRRMDGLRSDDGRS